MVVSRLFPYPKSLLFRITITAPSPMFSYGKTRWLPRTLFFHREFCKEGADPYFFTGKQMRNGHMYMYMCVCVCKALKIEMEAVSERRVGRTYELRWCVWNQQGRFQWEYIQKCIRTSIWISISISINCLGVPSDRNSPKSPEILWNHPKYTENQLKIICWNRFPIRIKCCLA